MTNEQFLKLPKYAQDEIVQLRAKVKAAALLVEQSSLENAQVLQMRYGDPNVGLPDLPYRFLFAKTGPFGEPGWIQTRRTAEGLHVMGSSGPLLVKMEVANCFTIKFGA